MTENGVCKIKPEFVLPEQPRKVDLDCVSEKDKQKLEDEEVSEPAEKKPKWEEGKKKLKGQNKARGRTFIREREKELCHTMINLLDGEDIKECGRKNCVFLHDAEEYVKIKPKDIADTCYIYSTFGRCNRGLMCRFSKDHITPEGRNKIDKEKVELTSKIQQTTNQLKFDVQAALRKKKYDFKLSENLIKHNDYLRKKKSETDETKTETSGAVTDEDIIKLLQREKKTINFQDKLFLSPLTTVGNLPFRRICKEYGADITCGEMAMCTSLLQTAPQEWALVKRHHTEDIFGVQLCASNPHVLTKCGQLLEQETDVDFIDLNLGCPIDLVYREGAGCGLLNRQNALEACIKNLSQILTIPLTVKTRMGIYKNTNIAHTLMPKFREWGASLVTIHGRSREQRYTKTADWNYIRQCAQAAAPMPVLGNGDILSYEDYKKAREIAPELAGVMIGRGALIKPWIFTEIKEQKLLDISSSERFDLLKKYTNYGLEHWGSDTKGVENTRRFLLEWLSFLHRYIPVGLLECPPQKINERPPYYKGRDDMETMMSSTSASDWIKISEMLLGPVPENFQFLPKHKANSYK